MSSEPFLFAIPLLARAVARDWDRVCQLLSCTLDSVLNQSDADIQVALVCHDVPDLPQLKDPRVVVLQIDAPLPHNPDEQMVDKGLKKRAAFAYLRELGGGWVMLVDADDLVSCRLVEYVRQVNAQYGMLIDEGWEFDCGTGKLAPASRFNRVCGTSAVFRFRSHELPLHYKDTERTLSDAFESHREWRERAAELNRPLAPVNFRAAVYTINNAQNHSAMVGKIGWRRRLLRLLTFSHFPSRTEISEFSIARLILK